MIKTVLLVPEVGNTGQPFPRNLWDGLDARLLAFGGFARQTGIEGNWVGSTRTFKEPCRQYTVSLATVRQLPAWLDAVEWVLEAFEQEAVFVEINGAPEILSRKGG